jgi:lipopolysaccharide/colanic/teichoic acid biosynthesis glycosyltransferase
MYKTFGKRFMDLVLSVAGVVLLMPFLLMVSAISLIIHGYGGVFFLQERVGYRGRIFKVVKFKTMSDKRDADGELLPDAERQTVWGALLRKYSIDELLQLINVIKNDMSLIGPRPLLHKQLANISDNERRRLEVKPGITGLAQVCGRNELFFSHRFKYDCFYVQHLSLILDAWIFIQTIKVILTCEGVDLNSAAVLEQLNAGQLN